MKNPIARLSEAAVKRIADVRETRRRRAEERWDQIDPDHVMRKCDASREAGNALRPLEERLRRVVELDEYAWGPGGLGGEGRLRKALELLQEEIEETLD